MQDIQDIAVVKLMRGNVVEYPITRPECVIYLDGTTVSSHIESLEDGATTLYNVYKNDNGQSRPVGTNMFFKDEESFRSYFISSIDCIKYPYYSYNVNGSTGMMYTWGYANGIPDVGSSITAKKYSTDSDVEYFNMKHFMLMMNGCAPNNIFVGTEQYSVLRSIDVVSTPDDFITCINSNYQSVEYDVSVSLKISMGKTSPLADNDYLDMYFIPSFVYNGSCFGLCYVINPYVNVLNS